MKENTTQTQEEINIVLHIDIGTVNTRVSLFERSAREYKYVGAVSTRTIYGDNHQVEYQSISSAIHKLESATDRHFLDGNDTIIVPQKLDMIGADQVIVSWSCGEMPRVVLIGLTDSVSLRNMRSVLSKTGIEALTEICAMQSNSLTENIDTLLRADPEMVLLAGGTENGAERALYRLGEILMFACKSMPEGERPRIVFMGNSEARSQFDRVFQRMTDISFARNVLQSGHNAPDSALYSFLRTVYKVASDKTPALSQLSDSTECKPILADFAYGRCIRLLSRMNRRDRVTLGIEVGASRTIAAMGRNLELRLSVLRSGIGKSIPKLLDYCELSEVLPWIGFQLKESEIRDYIYNKSVHPELVPANSYSAEIEQVLSRFIIKQAIKECGVDKVLHDGSLGLVLLGGAVIRNVEDPGDALRIGMDSLHPLGQVDYYLDMNSLATAIGSMAAVNRELTAQITNPSAFLNLGKVITPVSNLKDGKRIFSISLRNEAGNVQKFDIIQGGIKRIPLDYGKYYELDWFNMNSSVSIPGVQTWTPISFKSGCFGLVFDMRGKNLTLPKERSAQIHLLDRWKQELGTWSPSL